MSIRGEAAPARRAAAAEALEDDLALVVGDPGTRSNLRAGRGPSANNRFALAVARA